jgi:hypothetical protein
VEPVNGRSAELFVVDTSKALSTLFQKHPAEFEFLAGCMLEYEASEGLFKARHPIVEIKDGKISPVSSFICCLPSNTLLWHLTNFYLASFSGSLQQFRPLQLHHC